MNNKMTVYQGQGSGRALAYWGEPAVRVENVLIDHFHEGITVGASGEIDLRHVIVKNTVDGIKINGGRIVRASSIHFMNEFSKGSEIHHSGRYRQSVGLMIAGVDRVEITDFYSKKYHWGLMLYGVNGGFIDGGAAKDEEYTRTPRELDRTVPVHERDTGSFGGFLMMAAVHNFIIKNVFPIEENRYGVAPDGDENGICKRVCIRNCGVVLEEDSDEEYPIAINGPWANPRGRVLDAVIDARGNWHGRPGGPIVRVPGVYYGEGPQDWLTEPPSNEAGGRWNSVGWMEGVDLTNMVARVS